MTEDPSHPLPPEARRRVLRAALLRPWAVLVLVIGAIFFAATLSWWVLPLTLATYAALVLLAVRDPIFQILVLEGREKAREAARSRVQRAIGLSPEGRTRKLQRGETRDRVESALEARGRVILAIEEAGEPARNYLTAAIPEFQRTAELLVDLAEARERTAIKGAPQTLAAVDAQLSDVTEELDSLRAQVVRSSIEDAQGASTRASQLQDSIEEINLRLQELRHTI